VYYWLGVLIATLTFFTAVFWFALFVVAPNSAVARRIGAKAEDDAARRRAEGYRVNVPGFYAWLRHTRLRAALWSGLLLVFAIWFGSIASASR
jgi:hypothetical protein